MRIGREPPNSHVGKSGRRPSSPTGWSRWVFLLLIAAVSAVVGALVGMSFEGVEIGITAGAAALAVLRDVLRD